MPSEAHWRNSSHGTREDGSESGEKEKGLRWGPEEHLYVSSGRKRHLHGDQKGMSSEEEGQGQGSKLGGPFRKSVPSVKG